MRVRNAQLTSVGKMALERDLIPLAYFFRIQVIDHRQCVKLVETGSYIPIFNVRQAEQGDDEVGAPALARQFITGSLHIPVGQAETFAGPARTRARLHVWSGKIPW